MMKTKIDQDPRILEDMFYAKEFCFSYSSLNKLLYSPSLFYKHYILGERDDQLEKSLVEGRVIHALLLDQESFSEQFVIAQSKVPSDNIQDVINKVYEKHIEQRNYLIETALYDKTHEEKKLEDYSDDILEILKEKNFYQNIKKDEDRLAKIITEDNEEYFLFIKESAAKTIIDSSTYSRCVDVVDKLKNHSCMKIMGMDKNSNLENVMNELMIEIGPGIMFKEVGIKGCIDNLFIDEKNKTIRINDLKTTTKTLAEFPDTVKFYNYWMQAAMYMRMARSLLHNMNDEYKEFNMVFSFVVIDRYDQIYVFEVSQETMTEWEIDLQEKLKEAIYHYENREYSLPYKFVTSKVTL